MLPENVDPPCGGILSCLEIWLSAENTCSYSKWPVLLFHLSIISGLSEVFQMGNISKIQQRCKDYSSVIGWSLHGHYSIMSVHCSWYGAGMKHLGNFMLRVDRKPGERKHRA